MEYTCIKTKEPWFTRGKVYEIIDIGHEILIKETDKGKEETFPYPDIENFVSGIVKLEQKTGLGHQYKVLASSYGACQNSLGQAFMDIAKVEDSEAYFIRMEIIKLMNKCMELSYAANEAFKQNQ